MDDGRPTTGLGHAEVHALDDLAHHLAEHGWTVRLELPCPTAQDPDHGAVVASNRRCRPVEYLLVQEAPRRYGLWARRSGRLTAVGSAADAEEAHRVLRSA